MIQAAAVTTLVLNSGIYVRRDGAREDLIRGNEAMASRGLRVLAMASRTLPADNFDPASEQMPQVTDLTLQGLVGIMDPPRPEAKEAIRVCREAGVEVKMITGDHPVTACLLYTSDAADE